MKTVARLAALTLAPLALGSCGMIGLPQSFDVSGRVTGVAPQGTVRMALVGVNADGLVQDDSQQASINLSPSDMRYAVDLPADWKQQDGRYDVIAYIDADGDGRYDSNETRTQNNGTYLVYDVDGQSLIYSGLKAGLNQVRGTTAVQWGKIGAYDISW